MPAPSLPGDSVFDAPVVSLTGYGEVAGSSMSEASEAGVETIAVPALQQACASGCLWASFRILDTEQVPRSNGTSGFTRYRLCTSTTDDHSWIVYKRYSDFQNLRQRLVEAGLPGIEGLPFPKKKLRRKNSVREETVEEIGRAHV